jgi:hypothetical protein
MLLVTVVLAGCDSNSIRRPIRRSEQYRAAIAEYGSVRNFVCEAG